jgi:hypothetical protein
MSKALNQTGGLPMFDGSDYDHQRDAVRLTGQLERVFMLMRDSEWRTLDDIARATGDPPASVSAQLRHLRKARFGSHQVYKRHLGNGLYEYRLVVRRAA